MTITKLFSSVWMRVIVFLWMILFPILFVALPGLEMMRGEREMSLGPLWAFVVWLLGPVAVAIVLKYAAGETTSVGKN